MRKKNVKFIIGGVIVAVGIAYLVYVGIQKTGLFYLTVSELRSMGNEAYGEELRVNGKVIDGSIRWNSEEGTLHFVIAEGDNKLSVVHRGVAPDTFRSGAEVVLEGTYTQEDIFEAHQIMAKCPSKYEAREDGT